MNKSDNNIDNVVSEVAVSEQVTEQMEQAVDQISQPEQTAELKSAVMRERNMQTVTTKQKVGKIFVQIGLYLFLTIMALIVLFPFYWMIISSFKTLDEYYVNPPTFFPTQAFDIKNYAEAFTTGS